jgi:glycosyltransferase involved in cell wall biosynthesis
VRVAFDVACLRQTGAGTSRVARGLLGALDAAGGAEIVRVGEGELQARGSLGQKADALRQDLGWYGGGIGRAARRRGADLLHCPTFRGPLRRPGIPVVVTVHDLAVLREPSWFPVWSRSYGRLAIPRVLRHADRVVCVSRATAHDVTERLGVPEARLRVVENGVDALFSEPAGPPPVDGPYLLFVGTPEPRKNLPRLLAAHRELRRLGRPERLVLAGSGGWGGVDLPAGGDVVTLGRVPDAELRDLYAHAEAAVYPSLWEGYGLVAAEALAAGTRIVCADVPALREVAEEEASYCDPTSVDSIVEAVVRALSGPRPFARRPFTWERSAARLLDVWAELA